MVQPAPRPARRAGRRRAGLPRSAPDVSRRPRSARRRSSRRRRRPRRSRPRRPTSSASRTTPAAARRERQAARARREAELVIGRSREATSSVDDANISRRHAEIRQENGAYWIVDLGSTNGVEVNGRSGRPGAARGPRTASSSGGPTLVFESPAEPLLVEPILLGLKAAFLVLLYLFIWRVIRVRLARPAGARRRASSSRRPRRARTGAADGARAARAARRRREPVARGRLGARDRPGAAHDRARGRQRAPSSDGDDYASAHHARIESQRDGVWIVDLDSTNGTWVNGERMDGRRKLRDGDVVRIGQTELRFERMRIADHAGLHRPGPQAAAKRGLVRRRPAALRRRRRHGRRAGGRGRARGSRPRPSASSTRRTTSSGEERVEAIIQEANRRIYERAQRGRRRLRDGDDGHGRARRGRPDRDRPRGRLARLPRPRRHARAAHATTTRSSPTSSAAAA